MTTIFLILLILLLLILYLAWHGITLTFINRKNTKSTFHIKPLKRFFKS